MLSSSLLVSGERSKGKTYMKKYNHFLNEISGFEEDEQPSLGKLMLHMSLIAVLSILTYLIFY